MTKLGIAVKSVTKKMMTRSGHLFRFRAATAPRMMPKMSATRMAMRPIFAETLKDSPMVVAMSRPVFRETPKSPWSMFLR